MALQSPTPCPSVPQNAHMPILPQSNLHLDILMGRDETLECADFMAPGASLPPRNPSDKLKAIPVASEMAQPMDIHADMERKLRM